MFMKSEKNVKCQDRNKTKHRKNWKKYIVYKILKKNENNINYLEFLLAYLKNTILYWICCDKVLYYKINKFVYGLPAHHRQGRRFIPMVWQDAFQNYLICLLNIQHFLEPTAWKFINILHSVFTFFNLINFV